MGDEALRQVSNAVVRVFLRKSDFCARYGGDELAVVLRETAVQEAAAWPNACCAGCAR